VEELKKLAYLPYVREDLEYTDLNWTLTGRYDEATRFDTYATEILK